MISPYSSSLPTAAHERNAHYVEDRAVKALAGRKVDAAQVQVVDQSSPLQFHQHAAFSFEIEAGI
jgi:hypothetical protein